MMFFYQKIRPAIKILAEKLIKSELTIQGEESVTYKTLSEQYIGIQHNSIWMREIGYMSLNFRERKLLKPFMKFVTAEKKKEQKLMELLENEPKN